MRLMPLFLICLCATMLCAPAANAAERMRVFISTDMGGDHDDQASFVRFLLYSCEWDVVGIVAENRETDNRPLGNDDKVWVGNGVDLVNLYIDAYAEALPNLRVHDPRYASAQSLRAVVKPGHDESAYGELSSGAQLLITELKKDDDRPLWIMDWGTQSTNDGKKNLAIVKAIWHIQETESPAERARLLGKLHFSGIDGRILQKSIGHGRDATQIPELGIFIGTGRPPVSREVPTDKLHHWITEDHGTLGSYYMGTKEGDSNGFINLLPVGLSRPDRPEWGSWSGLFWRNDRRTPGYAPNYYGRGQAKEFAVDVEQPHIFPNEANDKEVWSIDCQHDFYNRCDWLVASTYAGGNHPPEPVVNGSAGLDEIYITTSNRTVALDASASTDPDPGNNLSFQWRFFEIAGSYAGSYDSASIANQDSAACTVTLPSGMQTGDTVHVVVRVRDDDAHRANLNKPWMESGKAPKALRMARYRRVIITWGTGGPVQQAPVANAGADQDLADSDGQAGETVTLDGSASSDSDGSIVSWVWSKDGSEIASGRTASVELADGQHSIVLTTTDNDGLSDTDTVVIDIAAPASLTRIVCIGDSITQGERRPTWRYWLWEQVTGAGYNVDFVGSIDHDKGGNIYPEGTTWDSDHDARWGWQTKGIKDNLADWLTGYTPDVALIHIGTNDVFRDKPNEDTLANIKTIIDILRADNPAVSIFLAQLIPARNDEQNAGIDSFNAALPTAVAGWTTTASPVRVVDQNTGYDPAVDSYDNAHPDETGEVKIAGRWFSALQTHVFGGGGDNTAPTITLASATPATVTGMETALSVTASDGDGDALSYTWTVASKPADSDPVLPAGLNPTVTFNKAGSYQFSVSVSDGRGGNADAEVSVTVEQTADELVITP